jgi:hypothetical protein
MFIEIFVKILLRFYDKLEFIKFRFPKNAVQLVAKKSGNENFPNVNLILSICQLIVYFTIPTYQII